MSVLIKGMEMPTSCEKCPFKTADAFGGLGCQATGYIPLRKVNQNRPDWCPLVPIPPHGRLIDADALQKDIQKHADLFVNCGNLDLAAMAQRDGLSCALSDVVNAPTIIEATEGE